MPSPARPILALVLAILLSAQLAAGERKAEKNIAYGPHERNVLDVYWDADFKGAPIVLAIHGGGFTRGDKSYCNATMQKLYLDLGCVVVSPNYRFKSAAAGLRECEIDCAMATAWIQANAEKFGGDPTRIVSTGGSAGGYLSARVAYRKKWDWPADAEHKPDRLNVIGWYGDSPFLTSASMASVAKGDPPGFMIYGQREHPATPAKSGHAMRARLAELGIWNGMVYVPKAGHVPGKKTLIDPKTRDKSSFAAFERFLKMVCFGEEKPETGKLITVGGEALE